MTEDAKIRRVQQGYQPQIHEFTKGYRPTQPVNMNNLKIPKNIGDAAVMPRNISNSVHPFIEPKKE